MWGPIAVSGFETGILEKESIKLQSQSVYYLMPNEGTYSYHIDLKCVAENLEYLCDTWKSIAGVEGARLSFYKGSIKKKMSLEHWWNDTVTGKQKYWERNLWQWHFFHHKTHTDWHGTAPTPWDNRMAIDRLDGCTSTK